jgi:hypothetical protein
MNGFKAYVAASRHRHTSWIVHTSWTSKATEMYEVQQRRPMGIKDPVSERNLWADVAHNLLRLPLREPALDMVRQTTQQADEAVKRFQAGLRKTEARQASGAAISALRTKSALMSAGERMVAKKPAPDNQWPPMSAISFDPLPYRSSIIPEP